MTQAADDLKVEHRVGLRMYGGPDRDDTRILDDWLRRINTRVQEAWITGNRGRARQLLIEIANLGLSGAESMDRQAPVAQ